MSQFAVVETLSMALTVALELRRGESTITALADGVRTGPPEPDLLNAVTLKVGIGSGFEEEAEERAPPPVATLEVCERISPAVAGDILTRRMAGGAAW